MVKTIVVGVDGSEPAAKAARKAAELAVALGAELHVLTAYGKFEMERYSSGTDEFIYSTERDAEAISGSATFDLRQEFPGLKLTTAAAEGKPGDALVKAADRLKADLIVVGNKRVQGITRVLGSVARDVAQRAKCDLYVAHTHQR